MVVQDLVGSAVNIILFSAYERRKVALLGIARLAGPLQFKYMCTEMKAGKQIKLFE